MHGRPQNPPITTAERNTRRGETQQLFIKEKYGANETLVCHSHQLPSLTSQLATMTEERHGPVNLKVGLFLKAAQTG